MSAFSPYKNDPTKVMKTKSLHEPCFPAFFMGEFVMKGSDMCEENQKIILDRTQRERWTLEFKGELYTNDFLAKFTDFKPQFVSDKEFLENSYYQVSKSGKLYQYFRTWVQYETWPEGEGYRIRK